MDMNDGASMASDPPRRDASLILSMAVPSTMVQP